MIDIDSLERVNDTVGDLTGDAVPMRCRRDESAALAFARLRGNVNCSEPHVTGAAGGGTFFTTA